MRRLILPLLMAWCIAALLLSTVPDDSDRSWLCRSGMIIHTDCKTGRQYLSVHDAIVPRLDQVGNQIIEPCQ